MTMEAEAFSEAPVSAEGLAVFINTQVIGRHILSEKIVDSTNRLAMDCGQQGAPEGLVAVADSQTGGRGRLDHAWFSPPGRNLYFSVLLRPQVAPAILPQLAMVAAVALRRALASLLPNLSCQLKWPNDVWMQGRKISGILCESACPTDGVPHVVIGIGLNVNVSMEELPEPLRNTATSLRILTGRGWNREQVLATVLNELERAVEVWLAAGSLRPFQTEWQRHSLLAGQMIRVDMLGNQLVGHAVGITDQGLLQVLIPDGTLRFVAAGDTHVVC